jgi:hypothetical protein
VLKSFTSFVFSAPVFLYLCHAFSDNIEQDIEGVPTSEWCDTPMNDGGKCALPNNRHSFNAIVTKQVTTPWHHSNRHNSIKHCNFRQN